jgi:hypothetical protein
MRPVLLSGSEKLRAVGMRQVSVGVGIHQIPTVWAMCLGGVWVC